MTLRIADNRRSLDSLNNETGHHQNHARRLDLTSLLVVIGAMTWATAMPAAASTDEAWDAFRADVTAQCTTAAQQTLSDIQVRVDPFGSEQYGLALIDGVAERADTRSQLICVYDKQEKTVELGTPLNDTALEHGAP